MKTQFDFNYENYIYERTILEFGIYDVMNHVT